MYVYLNGESRVDLYGTQPSVHLRSYVMYNDLGFLMLSTKCASVINSYTATTQAPFAVFFSQQTEIKYNPSQFLTVSGNAPDDEEPFVWLSVVGGYPLVVPSSQGYALPVFLACTTARGVVCVSNLWESFFPNLFAGSSYFLAYATQFREQFKFPQYQVL